MYRKKNDMYIMQKLLGIFKGLVLVSLFVGIPYPVPAAVLITQTVSGITDVANEMAQDWQPLDLDTPVGAGNVVRTDFSALADLLGDDGSFLEVAEATQLSVLEYEFNQANQVRVARFAILEGTITADAAHLDYPTNIFEVETPTVVASFKFSKAKITVDKSGNTDVTMIKGKFELLQKSSVRGTTRARHRNNSGVETELSLSEDGAVGIETTPEGLKTANIGNAPLSMNIGGQPVELSPGASIESVMDGGQPVIKNTSDSSGAQVKVGGVLVGSSGTLTLTQTGGQLSTASQVAPGTTPLIFQDINRGSTSSSIPVTTGTGGPTPGVRPPQPRIIRIPVEVVSKE